MILKLRFKTANSVLIISDNGIILQTDPHSLEMLVGVSNQHNQCHLDFLFENLSIGMIPSYLDGQSPESYYKSLAIAERLNILLQKGLSVDDSQPAWTHNSPSSQSTKQPSSVSFCHLKDENVLQLNE
jgi:hypothetical protein